MMFTYQGIRRSLRIQTIFLSAAVALLLGGPLALSTWGAPFTLIDDNSVVSGDTSGVFDPQSVTTWDVDGVDQLFQQGFWYRVGPTGPEAKVSTLPITVEGTTDTNFDTFDETLFVSYAGTGFDIEITLLLDGGAAGSGSSDMAENISITNNLAGPLEFHFFQYTDFDLEGSTGGDTAYFTNANAVRQEELPFRLTETVVTPPANHREIDFYSATLDSLNDGVATTLSDTPAVGVPLGPGDVTWSFQWDVTIAPGSTFQISKDKNLNAIPEPSSVLLAVMGLIGLAAFGWRRRKRA